MASLDITPTPDLPAPTIQVTCVMCHQITQGNARWCPGVDAPQHWNRLRVSDCVTNGFHLHRKCGICGFEWLEATLAT